ncbi:cysteine desulfurase family protein [Algisphaera agarilytica]|uniref:cysteine desulfurase n=1 Tax=Algisphaera agarilytica TaxID=1385975 RepID=A0A7X0H524_9BACT|nr:cysteine desulfurase family protein [Algisphaera agarilytica]MBB6429428.1 cysteine desulfurase [Algisphaera agarilytica]
MDAIYLDNNATTKPLPEVAAAVAEAHESLWANPSSVHRFGQTVRQRMELARASVAKLIGGRPRELVFTSGGTEANNLAIGGTLGEDLGGAVLITDKAEHAAVREVAEAVEKRGGEVRWLPMLEGGVVDVRALGELLEEAVGMRAEARTPEGGSGVGVVLLSVMWANNETGVIQPIREIAEAVARVRDAARQAGNPVRVVFHTDATQAVGKLPVDVAEAGVDLLTLAGHKFHGPKGAGALWMRRGVRVRPQQLGGPQETERRGGTENVPGLLGLGVAAEAAAAFVPDADAVGRVRALRDRFESQVIDGLGGMRAEAGTPGVVVNSGGSLRLWNTTNLGFRGLEAEAILLGLSERGVCASAGAACSSGSLEPSPVLRAMGVDEAVAHGSVRFSLSRFTSEEEIESAVSVVVEVVGRLSRVMPMGGG